MDDWVVPLDSLAATDAGRFGAKAARLAALAKAGLRTPGGFAVDAAAYRHQLAARGLESAARTAFAACEPAAARRAALEMKLGLMDGPIAPKVLVPLLRAWRDVAAAPGALGVVRSSALVEDRADASLAGQFESFLGLAAETEFIIAVSACWAALWSARALRYMATHGMDPADTAMALLIQPLVAARASGGGLSRTADGRMLLSATWGLGSAIAQGEVVPDRITLDRDGSVCEIEPGRKRHREGCPRGHGPFTRAVPGVLVEAPCLDAAAAAELGRLLRRCEDLTGAPVEIEWALDEAGFVLLQSRPLHLAAPAVPDEIWQQHPRLNGHPAGIGWGAGRARVIGCECELGRVGPGDVLVTKVAGPALGQLLPRVAGVVAELGGSTSHLASLARERGVPMVLGVRDATLRIPEGAMVAVDGVAGVVRWMC